MPIPIQSYAHVRLTVTDIERSRRFYESVFGLPVAHEVPEHADQTTREALAWLDGGVVFALGPATLLGLRPVAEDIFDENRVGLDHLSLAVDSHEDLLAAASTLDELGVPREPIKDIGAGWILEFRDPDNIALELFAATGTDHP